jgi:hypothetical protein
MLHMSGRFLHDSNVYPTAALQTPSENTTTGLESPSMNILVLMHEEMLHGKIVQSSF